MIPTSMLSSPQFGPPMRQPPPPPPDWLARNAAAIAVSAHFGKMPPPSMTQSAYLPGTSFSSKSSKQPQFREEVTIRNSDSGKSEFSNFIARGTIENVIPPNSSHGRERTTCSRDRGDEQDGHQFPESGQQLSVSNTGDNRRNTGRNPAREAPHRRDHQTECVSESSTLDFCCNQISGNFSST